MWHKILVGFDGSEGAKKAFSVAVKLASQFGAELHSISIEEKLPHYAATVGEVLESKQEGRIIFGSSLRRPRNRPVRPERRSTAT